MSKAYTVTIPGDAVVTSTITTVASPAAGGTTSGDGVFANGTGVTVIASHNPGYTFVNWTDGGVEVSNSAVYPFTVNGDRTLVANFLATNAVGACCVGGSCSEGFFEACQTFVCNVSDHLPPTFAGCFGDADGNGVVNAGDRGTVSANIGQTDPLQVCLFDLDGNGVVNAGDRGAVAANIGLCTAMPEYQNGSGLNGGLPDGRFESTFMGVASTCDTIVCP
jgi:hypothetical protein